MVLADITQIIMGVVLRRKEATYKSLETYEYEVFNLTSYEENINYELFYSEEDLENFRAKKGDLLFRLAFPLRVIEVDEKLEGKLINNQYCIIRKNDKKEKMCNIVFLKWFLRSSNAKRQFDKILIGTTIKTIPVLELRKLEIPDLDEIEQEKISRIVKAWDEQKKLYQDMIDEKEKYYNSIINKLIEKGNRK